MSKFEEEIVCNQKFIKKIMRCMMYVLIVCSVFHMVRIKTSLYYRTPLYRPINGGLNRYDLTLQVGEQYHLYIFGLNRRVSFVSTDIKVATVNLSGTVKAWRPGTTIIRVKSKGKIQKCRVRVVDLSRNSLKLHIGQTKRLYVKYAFLGVRFSSSDEEVVTVTSTGKVRAVGKGKAKVTASYRGTKMYCVIVVT